MDKKTELVKRFLEATQGHCPTAPPTLQATHGTVIFVIGDHNHIAPMPPPAPLITPKQCAWINRLVRDISKAEHRTQPAFSPAKVWVALNALIGVTTYKDIPRNQFDHALVFLNNWLDNAKQH